MPEFAVLTATLPERELLLEECRRSVAAQTVACTHLVGVDEKREGPSEIRNRLAASSPADWFLPLDDDDLLDPHYLELCLPHLDSADVVYPWCRIEGKDDWTPNRLFRPDPLLSYNFIPVTALVRAELWRDVGGMRTEPVEDWRFWQRCLGAGARFKVIDEIGWTYRIGAATTSRNEWQPT